jgi:hypothetical protein
MANVQWSFIDQDLPMSLKCGDLASAEPGGLPVYEVMSVTPERAWLRDVRTHRDHVLPTDTLCWRMDRKPDA